MKQETTVPLDWIAQRLRMGARSTGSREVGALARRLGADRKLVALHRHRDRNIRIMNHETPDPFSLRAFSLRDQSLNDGAKF